MKKLKVLASVALFSLFLGSACKKNVVSDLDDTQKNSKADAKAARAAVADFKVVGYMPSWAGNINQIQFSKLTHINYAFILPTATGGLTSVDANRLQSLVTLAHNNGKKVLIAVGGWNNGNDSAFETLAANPTSRTNFVNNLVNFVNQYNLDGVDIDWEYPDPGNSANNFAALMSQLSTAMHSRGKLLTAAVVSSGSIGGGVLSSVFPYVDFLNIMAYDGPLPHHSTYNYAVQSVNYWKNRGLPIEKAILGVPFYGRSASEYADYKDLLTRGANPYSDFLGSIGYNGITTIKSKTSWAYDNAGGVMIWDLNADAVGTNSLLTAIDQEITARNNSGNNPVPIGQTITLKGTNGRYVSGENGTQAMTCTRLTAQAWEQFTIVDAGGGKIALRSQNQYLSCENGLQAIRCNRATIQDWEKFTWVNNSDGSISLIGFNGKYVSSENGTQAMTCNRDTAPINSWETFRVNQ